jgi:alpha-tubulin suppressor-like RCC1 family protein
MSGFNQYAPSLSEQARMHLTGLVTFFKDIPVLTMYTSVNSFTEFVITKSLRIYTWGRNYSGMCGLGTTEAISTPALLDSLSVFDIDDMIVLSTATFVLSKKHIIQLKMLHNPHYTDILFVFA